MISYSPIRETVFKDENYTLDILRLDLMHPEVSGNKWFKLKANLEKARKDGHTTIATFGGANSNHIAATASACQSYNFQSIGVIRGEDYSSMTPTLKRAREQGMKLHFISRSDYALKDQPEFLEKMKKVLGNCYIIPEGGSNREGCIGCTEIADPTWNYEYVMCACGTGTTYGGLTFSLQNRSIAVGISVLKGENTLPGEVEKNLRNYFPGNSIQVGGNEQLGNSHINANCIVSEYSFTGFAGFEKKLIDFKTKFEHDYGIPLDHIYTTKLAFAAFDLIRQKKFRPGSGILLVHSGGLQGNKAFEERYQLSPTR